MLRHYSRCWDTEVSRPKSCILAGDTSSLHECWLISSMEKNKAGKAEEAWLGDGEGIVLLCKMVGEASGKPPLRPKGSMRGSHAEACRPGRMRGEGPEREEVWAHPTATPTASPFSQHLIASRQSRIRPHFIPRLSSLQEPSSFSQ